LGLACGGVSVDPGTHLQPLCDANAGLPIEGELVAVDRAANPIQSGIALQVSAAETRVDGQVVADGAALKTKLEERAQTAESISKYSAQPFDGRIVVIATPDTPASRIKEVLVAAARAGLLKADFILASNQPWDLPDYPDPDYAVQFKAQLDGVAAEERQMIAAQEIDSAVSLCPGAKAAFAAVANASPEMKCALIARGMEEALPTCLATNGDVVLTQIQVLSEPTSEFRPHVIQTGIDPKARPIIVSPDTPWSELAGKVVERSGQGIWLL